MGDARNMRRRAPLVGAACFLGMLVLAASQAPEFLPPLDVANKNLGPLDLPPFGTDDRGRPLLAYATQGAAVVALPSVFAGIVVALLAIAGGLLRCMGFVRLDAWVQAVGEVLGALPRMVVVLIVALVLPPEARSLFPLALVWALLSGPGAMDEAAAVAERLGGARFVEALRAHGYSRTHIYLYHVVALNLRPVVVRQGAETTMQVMFLEIALSYLALVEDQPSFTHSDSTRSWADLLDLGYPSLILDVPTTHALGLGLGLIAMVVIAAMAVTHAARAR